MTPQRPNQGPGPFLDFPLNNHLRQDTCRAINSLEGRTEFAKKMRSSLET